MKGFVAALLTRAQTSECMCSDLIAVSNWPSMPYCNSLAQSLSLGMRSYAFSKSTKHALTAFACSHDFSKICCKTKVWPIVLRPGRKHLKTNLPNLLPLTNITLDNLRNPDISDQGSISQLRLNYILSFRGPKFFNELDYELRSMHWVFFKKSYKKQLICSY